MITNLIIDKIIHNGNSPITDPITEMGVALSSMYIIAIRAVEFSKGGTKLERFLPKNQHPQRKLLNFENWISGGLRSFQNSEF